MKKLIIYDVDDTLFKGNQLIGMEVSGEFRWLTQQEFHDYDAAGTVSEVLDLSRLKCAQDWLDCLEPNDAVVESLLFDLAYSPADIVIMTARNAMDDHDLFKSGFEKQGIDTSVIEFIFAGDHGEVHWSSHKKKAVLFERFLDEYDEITIYDDNVMNLRELHLMALDHPFVQINSYHVHADGTINKYNGSE